VTLINARNLSLFCGAAVSVLCAGQAMAADVSFNIPRQRLAEALRAFGAQSGVSIVFGSSTSGAAETTMSPGVVGAFEPGEALRKILAGSSLTYVPARLRLHGAEPPRPTAGPAVSTGGHAG
jgi:hypothetical protein